MRMKLRSLQMILPRCFQLMGKHQYVSGCQYQPIDDRPPGGPPNTITKLIKLDGLVRIYRRPVHVSELMREFPKHMVCPSDSFYIGQRIPALSEQDQLELGHNYFLLPKHLCESALSIVTIASWSSSSGNSSISDTNKITTAALIRKKKKKAASSLSPCQQAVKQPFDIQKTASGCLRIRVSEEFIISQLIMEMEEDEEELKSKSSSANIGICTTEQLKKDYSQLVGWSRQRQWKPKLEMIRESTRETKSQRPRRAVPAVLLLSSSFKGSTTNIKRLIVRKKKKKKKKSQSSKKNHASLIEPQHLQLHQVVSSPSSSSSSSSSSVKKDRTKRLSSSSGTSTRLDKKERHH